MKAILFLLTLTTTAIMSVTAQNLIAVQNGGTPKFYTDLDQAFVNTQDGDTIYLPGGSFSSNLIINKKIHFIGVGHNPDSTNVTLRTILSTLTLDDGSDYGSITGIYFPLNINSAYGNVIADIKIKGNINGYTISRCYISAIAGEDGGTATNFSIKENIIGDLAISGENNFISNNIFHSKLNVSKSIIRNNVFLWCNPYTTGGNAFSGSSCIVENNIFPCSIPLGTTNVFLNNVNAGINGFSGTNQGKDNFLNNEDLNSIFIKYDPSIDRYKNDFHIVYNSPYKNAGKDGTDVGIYGGAFPWKDGSVPSNPHFQTVKIAPKTDASGKLNVTIRVAAQDN